jgi:3-dehydrosphinganine reductase
VLITGGSQGLGEAMAIELAQKGADVIIVSRTVEKLKVALDKVEAARVAPEQKFSYYSADLTNAVEAENMITSCERVPDIVICCAGISLLNAFDVQAPQFQASSSSSPSKHSTS